MDITAPIGKPASYGPRSTKQKAPISTKPYISIYNFDILYVTDSTAWRCLGFPASFTCTKTALALPYPPPTSLPFLLSDCTHVCDLIALYPLGQHYISTLSPACTFSLSRSKMKSYVGWEKHTHVLICYIHIYKPLSWTS